MIDFKGTWKQVVADLERDFGELRLKAHLGKAEARDLWSKAEEKLFELRQQTRGGKDSNKVRELRALLARLRRVAKQKVRTIRKARSAKSKSAGA
jgi:hypothetical protein